jgi:hypothetical protein
MGHTNIDYSVEAGKGRQVAEQHHPWAQGWSLSASTGRETQARGSHAGASTLQRKGN